MCKSSMLEEHAEPVLPPALEQHSIGAREPAHIPPPTDVRRMLGHERDRDLEISHMNAEQHYLCNTERRPTSRSRALLQPPDSSLPSTQSWMLRARGHVSREGGDPAPPEEDKSLKPVDYVGIGFAVIIGVPVLLWIVWKIGGQS